MDKKQMELLYKIVDLKTKIFSLDMKDRWNDKDYMWDRQYSRELNTLTTEYLNKYKELPSWRTINDVFAMKEDLKNQLGDDCNDET